MKRALIIVDVQNDFLPGGALAVSGGDKVIEPINTLMRLPFDIIIATKDMHPKNHCSFASRWNMHAGEKISLSGEEQILWPDHCVQGSFGSDLSPKLDISKIGYLVLKGQDAEVDSYSAFFDNRRKNKTMLATYLKEKNITQLFVTGLATNFCVLYSVRDALSLGFLVTVITDACVGIELAPGDVAKTLKLMKELGASLTTTAEVIRSMK